MNKKGFVRAVSCACWFSFCATAFAQQGDWQPTLVKPEGVRGPGDPIQLLLPKLPVTVLQSIALELDDVDVTGLVSTPDGEHASFTPPQPLAYGEHSLRLIEYAPDGNIIERGVWTIDVRKSAAFREASLQSNMTVNLQRRIADENLAQPEPSMNHADGAVQLQGAIADKGWRGSAYIDMLGNSQSELMPRRDDKIDMGQFLLTGETGAVSAQVGDQLVGPDSLIMQKFVRRGVSAGLRSQQGDSSVVGFSVRTSGITGFQQGLGIGEGDNRTDGVVITSRPISADRDALVLWATYLTSQGASQAGTAGAGIAGDPTATSGTAASLAADSQLLNKRLRLRGEIAKTRFDFDGAGRDTDFDGVVDSDLPPESSRAHTALVAYTPWHDKLLDGKPLAVNFGVENRRIGTFFRSAASPAGIADRDLLRAFTNLNWSGLDLQLSTARETDNVDKQELLPRTETRQHFVAASYAPQINLVPASAGEQPSLPWYGQPSFSASWLGMNQDVTHAVTGFETGALRSAGSTTLGAIFNYSSWNWGVNHSLATTDDLRGFSSDLRVRTTQLNAGFRVGTALTLTPTLQVSDTEELDPPAGFIERSTKTTTARLSLNYLFSDTLYATLAYGRNKLKITDGSVDSTTDDIDGNLSWIAVRPIVMRPGVTFSLAGSYREKADSIVPVVNQPIYQIFLKAAIGWSPSF